jgi:queuosine precursor transporter
MPPSIRIYTTLCTLFSVLIVTGNLIYQKFVALPLFPFHTFELSVGAILYPLTFLLTDLITEFYGKEKANFCVKLGLGMNILIAVVMMGMDSLTATHWSKIDNTTFHHVFGLYSVAFMGSILACYIAQLVDIRIYLGIRRLTGDTSIVISFMTLFGVLPVDRMGALIMNSYLFKLFFTVCSTPLFYMGVTVIKRLMQKEEKEGWRNTVMKPMDQKAA